MTKKLFHNYLCCQSDVFEAMFLNVKTIEAKSGKVKIHDFRAVFKKTNPLICVLSFEIVVNQFEKQFVEKLE